MPKQLLYQKIKIKESFEKTQGFTLLEVLVVLGIILILSHVASTSYQHYIMRAARTNAKVVLLKTAAALESYYSQQHTYVGAQLNDLGIPSVTEDGRYRIVLSKLSQSHYLIIATPQGAQRKGQSTNKLILDNEFQWMRNRV